MAEPVIWPPSPAVSVLTGGKWRLYALIVDSIGIRSLLIKFCKLVLVSMVTYVKVKKIY